MRKETKMMKNIRTMYQQLSLQEESVLHRAKKVLSIYRDAVWSVTERAENIICETSATYGQDLGTALAYLADFAPTEQQNEFESKVTNLFETKWLIELVDKAMQKVHSYHSNGQLYYEILLKCYTGKFNYSETEILQALGMERSTYFDRKKEAIMLLGIALWGYAIPQLRGIYDENTAIGMEVPVFYRR
jgi:hypothetical protein